jgi:tetrahydromethanopterin S-methyltransferase subunit F
MEIIDQVTRSLEAKGIETTVERAKEKDLYTIEFKNKLNNGTIQTTVLDVKYNKILAIYGRPYQWKFLTEVDGLSSDDLFQLVNDLVSGNYEIKTALFTRRSMISWRVYRAKK